MVKNRITLIIALLAGCQNAVAQIDLATGDPFRVAYWFTIDELDTRRYQLTQQFAFRTGVKTHGEVITDTPFWTYRNWRIDAPAASFAETFTLPVGLDAVDFTFTFNIDPWSWSMPGPVTSEVTQPGLGKFRTTGFPDEDVILPALSGSWSLAGQESFAAGEFVDLEATSQSGTRRLWAGVELSPPQLKDDSFHFGLGHLATWQDLFAVQLNVTISGPGQAGDVTGDGDVDFRDFLILSANFGTSGDLFEGDLDGDGQVAFSDFLILSANFQQSGNASVPEPSFGLLIFPVVLIFHRKRRLCRANQRTLRAG